MADTDLYAAGFSAGVEAAAAHLDALAIVTPLGHENTSRGASTYNWLRAHAKEVRSIKAPDVPDLAAENARLREELAAVRAVNAAQGERLAHYVTDARERMARSGE